MKMFTLDNLSNGRVILSVGLGAVEFMVYGSDIHELEAQSKTLNVIKSEALSSPNYLFVTVHVPLNIIEGQHKLTFTNTKGKRVGSLLFGNSNMFQKI